MRPLLLALLLTLGSLTAFGQAPDCQFTLKAGSGNLLTGTVRCYGLAK